MVFNNIMIYSNFKYIYHKSVIFPFNLFKMFLCLLLLVRNLYIKNIYLKCQLKTSKLYQ